MKKISIVVPVYNVEKYLRQCVDSILIQSYKNLEIILIDDGSTDKSGVICDEYSDTDKRIKVIHKNNEGLGLTRNTGISVASGDYVFFIDSDDYLGKDCIAKLYDVAIKEKSEFVKAGAKRVTDEAKEISKTDYKRETFKNEQIKKNIIPRLICSSPNKHDGLIMSAWNTLYEMDVIKKHKLKFHSEREIISEDLVFNLDYLEHAKVATVSDSAEYYYRYNPNSLTTSYRQDRFERSKYLYNLLLQRFENSPENEEISNRVRKMFFINIRVCMVQERKTISRKKSREALASIACICNDNDTKNAIEKYPVGMLGLKQRMFIFLVKHKFNMLILLFINLNVIK